MRGYKNDRKVHLHLGTDATDESIGHKQQHQVSQGKFSKCFTGIYHIFHNFMSLKNSSVVSS